MLQKMQQKHINRQKNVFNYRETTGGTDQLGAMWFRWADHLWSDKLSRRHNHSTL